MNLFKIFFLLILVTFGMNSVAFTQSKKKLNIQLTFQHDSLVGVIHSNEFKVDSVTTRCENINQSLLFSQNNFKTPDFKEDFKDFKRFYEKIENANKEFEIQTNQYIEKLKKRYPLFSEEEFLDYVQQMNTEVSSNKDYNENILTQKFKLDNLKPNLVIAEKVRNKGEWNNNIFAQNQSLKFYIELQENYIINQTSFADRLKHIQQKNISLYQEFHRLMVQTRLELVNFDKAYSEWLIEKEKKEAEIARLEAVYWKKNKRKTVEFIPPVVREDRDLPPLEEKQERYEDIQERFIRDEPKQEQIVEIKAEKRQQEEIFTFVDEPAEYPGGNAALKKYMKENLLYPESAREIAIEGKVYVRFIISKNGIISNVTVLRGIPDCIECDKEAIRLIISMPNWKPSKINGKEVNSTYNLPVTFKIE